MGQKILARDWTFEINTGTGGVRTYTVINGINTFSFDPEKTDADTTTFDSEGYMEHIVASRTATLTLDGLYYEDTTTGARDTGQDAVEQLSQKLSQESIEWFRITTPFGVRKEIQASAVVSGIGGGNDDPTAWSAELTITGRFNLDVVNPTAISVSPTTLTVAAGAISAPILVTFTPTNTTDQTVTFASGNTATALVTPEGRVVGIAAGSTDITTTSVADGSLTGTTTVTVT